MVERDGWSVFKCAGCGLGVLDPRPDREELGRLYEKEYFDSQYREGLRPGSPEMRRRISQEDHRIRFFRRFKKRGLVVDIGCGMGYFLYAARQAGYDVTGVDISDHAASYVRDELGIPMRIGHIDAVDVVIHYEPAPDHKTYLHRSGRTARAGSKGLAVSLSLWNEELHIKRLQKRIGVIQPITEMFSNDPRLEDLTAWTP